jgi:RND family efflux transporter MFP subunit
MEPPRLGRIALAIGIVVAIAAFAGFLPRWRQRDVLRAGTQELAVPTVITVAPSEGKNQAGLALPAEIKAWIEAPIYARASGYLKRWMVDLGASVAAGQLLAEIDTPELSQELARSRAQLAQAEAALGLSKATAARWADLIKTDSVSEQEAAEKQADYTLKMAVADAARADVRRQEELASFARVTAPFDGTITARQTDVGQLISSGSGRELFRLAQTKTLRVYIRVPQSMARSISPGQKAELTLSELPGRVFTAPVVRTSGVMDAQSRTLLIELELDNASGEILAGSYAQARFPDARPGAARTLPSNTLLFRAEGPQVGVVKADNRIELRNIRLGRDFGATLEILEGVNAEERVVLNPSDSLVSGSLVRVAEPVKSLAPK